MHGVWWQKTVCGVTWPDATACVCNSIWDHAADLEPATVRWRIDSVWACRLNLLAERGKEQSGLDLRRRDSRAFAGSPHSPSNQINKAHGMVIYSTCEGLTAAHLISMKSGVISTRLELEGRNRALPCHTSLRGIGRELECPNVTNQPQKRWGRKILETSSNSLKTMRNYIVFTSSLTPTHLSRCLYLSLQRFPLQLLLCVYTEWVDEFVRWARREKASNPVSVRTSQGLGLRSYTRPSLRSWILHEVMVGIVRVHPHEQCSVCVQSFEADGLIWGPTGLMAWLMAGCVLDGEPYRSTAGADPLHSTADAAL